MVDIRDVERLLNGGTHFHWTYKMAGIRFDGSSEDIEYEVNQRVVTLSKGGIDSRVVWTFQPEANGTRVTCENEYTAPMPVVRTTILAQPVPPRLRLRAL